jgi:hypothetical protein
LRGEDLAAFSYGLGEFALRVTANLVNLSGRSNKNNDSL